jgi:hypothetical protein
LITGVVGCSVLAALLLLVFPVTTFSKLRNFFMFKEVFFNTKKRYPAMEQIQNNANSGETVKIPVQNLAKNLVNSYFCIQKKMLFRYALWKKQKMNSTTTNCTDLLELMLLCFSFAENSYS